MYWKLEESRLVQLRAQSSAANADVCDLPAVPLGKIWVILACGYMPDVNETQVVSFYKVSASGAPFCILNPLSMALNPAMATFIEQGMEYPLLPGEYIRVRRGNHTAGSTMGCTIQFVEIDQPIYTYEEPLIVHRHQRALSSIRSRISGGVTGGGGSGPAPGGLRGPRGGGGPLPV